MKLAFAEGTAVVSRWGSRILSLAELCKSRTCCAKPLG